MNLLTYEYTCYCENVFKALQLPGDPYGEFLLRSEIDELAYFDAISSRELKELNEIVDTYFPLKDRKDIDKVEVIWDLLSIVFDLSPQKKIYFLNKRPNCPECHSPYQIKSWIDVYPPEIAEVEIREITFKEWNKLNKDEKLKLVEKGLEVAIDKSMEITQQYCSSPSPPDLSAAEWSEVVKKNKLVVNKNFKMMVLAFRKLRGLDPASPIGEISFDEDPSNHANR